MSTESTRRRKLVGWAARIAVTVALVAFVVWRLDLKSLVFKVRGLDPGWIIAAFGVVFAAIAVSAYKWGTILRSRGKPLSYPRLLRHYFVGLFFNNVLPTSVGGDAIRAWETTKETGEVPEAVGSVISERLIAGAALGATALLGLPFAAPSARLVWLVGCFLIVDLALVALFLVPKFAEGIVSRTVPSRLSGFHGIARETVGAVRQTLRSPRLFLKVLILSILFQVLVAAVNACLFSAMGIEVGLARCVVYTPMIFTVTMLPISLSGLGVREAAYWYFFARDGVAQIDAVAVSICFFIVVAVASIPGAPLFGLERGR